MTSESIYVQLTYEELATLDSALQDHAESLQYQADPLDPQGERDQSLLESAHQTEALRQRIDRIAFPDSRDPMQRVKAAADAVIEADGQVTQLIERRRQEIAAAYEAGYKQTVIAELLGVSQSRIAHMLRGV